MVAVAVNVPGGVLVFSVIDPSVRDPLLRSSMIVKTQAARPVPEEIKIFTVNTELV